MRGNAFGNNPKTTLAGLVMVVVSSITVINNPGVMRDTEKATGVVTSIAAGLGLIFARDSKEADPVRPPTIPLDTKP